MNKFSLCLLSGVLLSQTALAGKPTIYKSANDPRQRVTEQTKLKSKDMVEARGQQLELIKIQSQTVAQPVAIKEPRMTEEQLKERDQLIEKYTILEKERQYDDAKMVAEILANKYNYQVDTSLLEPAKLSDQDLKVIAEYQQKYDYLLKSGDTKAAAQLDSDIYAKYGVNLVATRVEATRLESRKLETQKLSTIKSE